MIFLIKGIILGFSIAVPVGPIGIHCIRKTLQYGRLSGLVSGFGAAAADLVYGLIAAFGLTLITDFLVQSHLWIRLFGGIFLLYLGAKTFFANTTIVEGGAVKKTNLLKDFSTTFFLTLANPMTIVAFLAIFAGLGLSENEGNPLLLVVGVFVGSALWWLLLCEFVTLFRKRTEEKMMKWLNRGAGLTIFGFGLAALIAFILAIL